MRYLPGQYARICLPKGDPLLLPIANCPCEPNYLEFHLPLSVYNSWALTGVTAGSGTTRLRPRERISIDGPYGNFTINDSQKSENSVRGQTYLIALGEGFAAVKPLLEHIMTLDNDTPCTLIWIATDTVSQYKNNLCRSWADAFDCITYQSLASIELFTEEKITSLGISLYGVEIYISGERHLQQSIKSLLLSAGIDRQSIHDDTTCLSTI